ncbi:MAG: leucine-rich repeat domain-containing protein [Lachnospiraceae bacterium]|nr:leucine-rich repeat domain-containing protein [Lachnospiraceae bacterium]
MREKLTKYFVTIMFVLLSAVVLQPTKSEAAVTFEDIPVYVVDDMIDYDQKIGLSWRIDWNLDRKTGVTEECRYAKFTLAEDSIVHMKIAQINWTMFTAENYFRLYGNESMAVPLIDHRSQGEDYFLLKAGTYYVQCGSKIYIDSSANHSTRIMIGAVPVEKAVEVEQTTSADRTKMTVTVTQKFATELEKAQWCEGKVTKMPQQSQKLDNTNSFTVDKNGWYTVLLQSTRTYYWNEGIEHYVYINVTGIGEGAKKGVTYKSNNLKYKLVKKGGEGAGTVMVTGMVKQKSSITIPQTVKIKGQSYKIVKINSKAFYKKSKVKKVTIQSTYITSIGKNAFKGIHKNAVFKVPKSKYKTYKKMLTSKIGFAKKTMKIKK